MGEVLDPHKKLTQFPAMNRTNIEVSMDRISSIIHQVMSPTQETDSSKWVVCKEYTPWFDRCCALSKIETLSQK